VFCELMFCELSFDASAFAGESTSPRTLLIKHMTNMRVRTESIHAERCYW
jgi:hypothetical protein